MQLKRVFGVAAAIALLGGCAKMTLAWADLSGRGPAASPQIFNGPAPSIEEWERRDAPMLRRLFEEHVYGAMPEASSVEVVDTIPVQAMAFGGRGVLEEYLVVASATFASVTRKTAPFYIDVLLPRDAAGPTPIILMETFCPRWDTIPVEGLARPTPVPFSCNDGGMMSGTMNYVFGRYIATPPIEMILERGYGIASIYPGEAIPDSRRDGVAALAALAEGRADQETRWGAIGAWAWLFSRAVDVLEKDDRIDDGGLIVWGHSRYGKSALVAAAFDARIDGVVSHQSGTGGASLNRRKKGEGVGEITRNYPHWFNEKYASYAGAEETMPVDQHQLLALIAPRPVLLGNARRDVWSDPNGAFRAAVGADPVYEMYGARGLDQRRLDDFNPDAELSFWIRPGTHGVVKEDWPAFLDFLDAHFKGGGG